jgi:vacuolar protein sorting-associated protein 53
LTESNSSNSRRFVKRATQSTSKIDSLLKTLQVRPSPPEALVQAYLIHIADRSDVNFKKILDIKGIRKIEQSSLVDLFNAHCQSDVNQRLPLTSALMTSLQSLAGNPSSLSGSVVANAVSKDSHARSNSSGSPMGGNRFDPSTFGSAIMNAAREGVDRLGSPIGGESASAGDRLNDSGPGSNLNENLKNFGRFFKREGGAFGRFSRSNTEGAS